MTAAKSERILHSIRRLAGETESTLPDDELLRRYLGGEQSAFTSLVRRHAAMVFGVCRSVLRRPQDAEDASQATFLVLARRAGSIRRRNALGSFLHGVAYRVALKAKVESARRQAREAQTPPRELAESSCDDLSWGELRAVLHEELAALPERFRTSLVLCYLEGLTQEEAARRLNCTPTTIKGRLQRGREKLRRRLERRGVALTAALAAALTGQALAETAVRGLRPFTAETATAAAAALAQGVLRPLVPWKLAAIGCVLAAALVAGGAGALSSRPEGQGPQAASADKPDAESPAPRTDLYGDPLPEGAVARMGSMQLRHAGQSDFMILPDGKTALTVGGRALRFWDLATGKQVREVKLQGAPASGVVGTPSPDGKTLAALDRNRIILWEIDSGRQIKTLPDPEGQWAHSYFAPDGKTLVVGTWGLQLYLWDWQKGTSRRIALPARRIGMDSTFHSCVSPDGKFLAGGGGSGELLCVYDLASGREIHRLCCNASTSTFSRDSKRLIVSSMNNDKGGQETVIRIFDLTSGKEVAQYPLGHEHSYFSLTVSPDGKTLACGFSDRSCLLDLATGRVLHHLSDRPGQMAFTPDGKTLVANMFYRLRLWDVASGKVLRDRPGDFGWSLAMAVSPDGRMLAAADWMDQAVSLWDTASGRLLRQLPLQGEKRYVRNLAFSSDGKTLAACQYKGLIQFWETASGKERRTVQLDDPSRSDKAFVYFFQLHLSQDSKHVSTLEQFFREKQSTRLASWDAATGKLVSQHLLPPQSRACAWSADGTTAALPLDDGLKLMQVETGAVRFRIPGTRSGGPLATSPDDRLLAAVEVASADGPEGRKKGQAVVGIWETATSKEVATVATGRVFHLALTPDNRHLVATDEKHLRVWNLATGKERCRRSLPEAATLNRGEYAVTRLVLSPDGRRAFTALGDGTALVWDLTAALRHGEPLVKNPSEKELAAWWTDLLAEDAHRAYAAIWRLSESPEASLPFLRQRLKPVADADVQQIRQHIADLDSDNFASREKAVEQLVKLGETVEPALRHALEKNPSLETRRRIQLVLERLSHSPPTGEALRTLRALEVVEHAGTAEARRLLRELAGGAEDARQTQQARAALNRLTRRSP